jgi:hypothetical protein
MNTTASWPIEWHKSEKVTILGEGLVHVGHNSLVFFKCSRTTMSLTDIGFISVGRGSQGRIGLPIARIPAVVLVSLTRRVIVSLRNNESYTYCY